MGAATAADAVNAGTIASSAGSATTAPIPRRNVRRGSDIFLMNMEFPFRTTKLNHRVEIMKPQKIIKCCLCCYLRAAVVPTWFPGSWLDFMRI